MKFDERGTVVMENGPWPGNIGDSMAETSRFAVLYRVISPIGTPASNLPCFMTPTGYIRHPTAPAAWREGDTTSDQLIPYLMALDLCKEVVLLDLAKHRCKWTCANSKIAHPALMALARGSLSLFGILTIIQALVLMIPFRWSDDDSLKGKLWKFVSSEGSTADYINFAVAIYYLKEKNYRKTVKLLLLLQPADKILSKVKSYYANEPQTGDSIQVSSLHQRALQICRL